MDIFEKNYTQIEVALLNLQGQCSEILSIEQNKNLEALIESVNKKNPVLFENLSIEIFLFLSIILEKIIYKTIQNENTMKLRIINTNIKRIDQSIGQNLLDDTKLYISINKLFISISESNNPIRNDVINLIINYSKYKKKEDLDEIFLIGIKNSYIPIIDRLRNFVEIMKFVKQDHNIPKNKSVLKRTRGLKLIEYLDPEYKQ